MLKLELLKSNTTKIVQVLLENQKLCKLINYNNSNPYNNPDLSLPAFDLLFNKVFPYAFDIKTKTELNVYLHVLHSSGKFNSNTVEQNYIAFDIIVPKEKDYWLIDGGEIRPESIMCEIVNSLSDKDIGLGGKINFINFKQVNYNDVYGGIQMLAEYVNFSKGKK